MSKFKSFKKFIETSDRGDKYVYHRGFLMVDRKNNDIVAKTAQNALDWYEKGILNLVQRKISEGTENIAPVYEYVAVRVYNVNPRPFVGCYAPEE